MKLRELASKAGIYNLDLNDETDYWILDRFAKLIVQECVELNKQELSFTAFERLLNKYQDHFGVKS
jgi:hypothetical protein